MNIFQVLREPGLRGEIAGDHFFSLGVHRPRIGRTFTEDGQRQRRVEAQRSGEREPFGERRAIQAENQVGRQLHPRPSPHRPDVERGPGQAVEDVAAPRERASVAPRHDHHVAAAGLLAGAGDRGVEVGDPLVSQAFGSARRFRGSPVVVSTTV